MLELSPILVTDLDRYYLLKPANYRQELRLRFPNASKYLYKLVDYLLYQVEQNTRERLYHGNKDLDPWAIRIGFTTLGYKLRMDAWITSRNWKAMRTSLDRCYSQAKEAGWLLGYKTEPKRETRGLEILTLNPEKFRRAEELKQLAKETPKP